MGRIVRIAVFLTVVILVLGGLHFYVWARLVRDPQLPQPWALTATAALIALGAGLPLMRILMRGAPGVRILGWPLFTWLGVLFLFFALFFVSDLLRLLLWAWTRLRAAAPLPVDVDRRTLIARVVAGTVTAATAVMTAAAMRSALGPVAVRRVPVTLPRRSRCRACRTA